MTSSAIEPGDSVYVGEPSPTKVIWTVKFILAGAGLADLRSGMTERRRTAPVTSLHLHSKKKDDQ